MNTSEQPTPSPDYTNFRITDIWAFLSIGPDGEEGVIGGPVGPYPMLPYVAADKARVDQLRPLAQQIATLTNTPVVLAHFSTRTNLEVLEP